MTPDKTPEGARPAGLGQAEAAGEAEEDSRRSGRPGETGNPAPLRRAQAHARRHHAGTEPSINHRAVDAVTRRPPVC